MFESEALRSVVSRPLTDRRAGAGHTRFLPLVLGATGLEMDHSEDMNGYDMS